jgi:hypothetical protein
MAAVDSGTGALTMARQSMRLLSWAVGDVLRHPFENLLISLALALTIAALAVPLLLSQAIGATTARVLAGAPDLIVRKVSPGGWAPIPAAETLRVARSVPGVTRAEPRTWGVVASPQGTVTIVGVGAESTEALRRHLQRLPGVGEAVLGPGIGAADRAATLALTGETVLELHILETLPADTGLALNDVVLVNVADANLLLGLKSGWASDLAVYVFHPQEADAIRADLAAAFPWPVRITTRAETARIYSTGASRRGGLTVAALAPAVLSLCLLVAASVRERIGRRHEVGLLKALGWTTGDIMRFQIFRSVFIGVPGTAAGVLAALYLVFSPGITWPGTLFFGWQTAPPALHLELNGAAWMLPAISGLVLLPFLSACLAAALKSAVVDPQEILERDN